jgi:hypothetical protein
MAAAMLGAWFGLEIVIASEAKQSIALQTRMDGLLRRWRSSQ